MRYFVDWRLCGGRGAPAVFAKVLLWKQSIGPSARRAQNTGSYVGVYGGKPYEYEAGKIIFTAGQFAQCQPVMKPEYYMGP